MPTSPLGKIKDFSENLQSGYLYQRADVPQSAPTQVFFDRQKAPQSGSFLCCLVGQAEIQFVIIAVGVAVGVSLTVFILQRSRHILVLVVTGNVVGGDADAVFVDGQNLIAPWAG